MSKVIDNIEDIASIDTHIGLSGVTAYHLLQGNLAVDNTVITQGFNTTLYTGNGSTQSINTGIDMDTQWGNDASEKFGGLVWLKGRNVPYDNYLFDTVRGATKRVLTSQTVAETVDIGVSSFSNNGYSLGSAVGMNQSSATYASWNFQTTHRVSGTTNHGKAYTCHFNPFTGFTIVKYVGSGIAGHEIPHHLGRKLGFLTVKNLSAVANWVSHYRDGNYLYLNTTVSEATGGITTLGVDNIVLPTGSELNTSTNQYILYGWANSYYDENKLIGNYEVGIYNGTGASGNKVVTRGKPAWVMTKSLTNGSANWCVFDNTRANDGYMLRPNLSNAENTGTDYINFKSDGFDHNAYSDYNVNESGGQYLYMVAYDTNSNGGGGYYSRATDAANVQIVNGIIPLAKGIDINGTKITTVAKNETITGVTYTQGKNYLYWTED